VERGAGGELRRGPELHFGPPTAADGCALERATQVEPGQPVARAAGSRRCERDLEPAAALGGHLPMSGPTDLGDPQRRRLRGGAAEEEMRVPPRWKTPRGRGPKPTRGVPDEARSRPRAASSGSSRRR
jgi:hypothetical protein